MELLKSNKRSKKKEKEVLTKPPSFATVFQPK
jgi:hypothetical protein